MEGYLIVSETEGIAFFFNFRRYGDILHLNFLVLRVGWEGSGMCSVFHLESVSKKATFKKLFCFDIISDLQKFQNRRKNSQLHHTPISEMLTLYYICFISLCLCMYTYCTYILNDLRVSCSYISENDRIGNSKNNPTNKQNLSFH